MSTQRTGAMILRTDIVDGATIESHGDEVAGFPVENIQHPQPRVKWASDDPDNTFFILDLQQSTPRFFTPIYNAVSALFYEGRPATKWRVRTGPTSTGTGSFDSGEVFMWPGGQGGPSDYRSTLFYQPIGSHAHMLMTADPYSPTETRDQEFHNFLVFPGTSGSFVNFGNVLDPIPQQGTVLVLDIRFRNSGPPANQMLVQKGVSSVNSGSYTGYFLGLTSSGTIKAGVGDVGVGTMTAEGGSYTDNDWHTARVIFELFQGFPGSLILEIDGTQVDSDSQQVDDPQNDATLRWGTSQNGLELFSGDVERAILSRGDSFDLITDIPSFHDQYMASPEPDTLEYPDFNGAAWTVNEGTGTVVGARVVQGEIQRDGAINGSVTWAHLSSFYSDRYMRVDFMPFFSGIDQQFKLGRFVVDLALEPIVPAPYRKPTPIGAPSRGRVSWRLALTKDQFESIAYAIARHSGSSPRTLRSWGSDTFILDGARTIAAVNNVLDPDPWSRHQQTIYGYIDSMNEVSVQGDLHLVDVTLQGI